MIALTAIIAKRQSNARRREAQDKRKRNIVKGFNAIMERNRKRGQDGRHTKP